MSPQPAMSENCARRWKLESWGDHSPASGITGAMQPVTGNIFEIRDLEECADIHRQKGQGCKKHSESFRRCPRRGRFRQGAGRFGSSVAAARIIRQDLLFAFLYNALAIPLAVAGFLNPLVAVCAMFAGSLTVIGNTLRSSRFSRKRLALKRHGTPIADGEAADQPTHVAPPAACSNMARPVSKPSMTLIHPCSAGGDCHSGDRG